MDLIDSYLKREHSLDLNDKNDSASQEAKLEYFFKLFIELEKRYNCKLEDMKRLDIEHKEEISELQDYVYKVKQLTEEREKLTIDFKDENDELKNKIKALERELNEKSYTHKSSNRQKSDASSFSDDDLSEATIEMLVLEGFGNIVASPNHEKIAVILADRAKLIEEIKLLKKELNKLDMIRGNTGDENSKIKSLYDQMDLLEDEIEILKSTNLKLSYEIENYKHDLNKNMNESEVEMSLKNEVILLNEEIEELREKLAAASSENKSSSSKKSNDDEDEDDSSEEHTAVIEAAKFEINKLKEDNLNLKMEMDKLYDEISTFEIETKQLKDENKKYAKDIEELNEALNKNSNISNENQTNLDEIKKLKQEIDDLNNELDDLIQYKANYDRIKIDYDKLNTKLQETQMELRIEQQEQFIKQSPRKTLTPSNSFKKPKPGTENQEDANLELAKNKSQMELEWIRGENEKLLLDLEKTQTKLNDKINQYNELKELLEEKDEQMKEFIKKYEKEETNNDDLLNLQKKILELEHLLNQEKEERSLEIESNEERQKDLLKRNDHLWSQLTKLEQNHKDALEIIKNLTQDVESLEAKMKETELKINSLSEEKSTEILLKEKQIEKTEKLEMDLDELNKNYDQLKSDYEQLNTKKLEEAEKSRAEIESLNKNIDELNETVKDMDKTIFNLKLEIDGLNKEKAFIMGQNETTQQKVLQDYLSLQEKHTSASFQLNKINNDFSQLNSSIKEKELAINNLEVEKNQLNITLNQEIKEKKDALEKLKQLETNMSKGNEKINELTEKFHRLEIQKSKLEIKAKDLEALQGRYDQLNNELNDKRETLSQVLEKNGKLEGQISNLERQLNDTKHSLIQSDSVINELNHFKTDTMSKSEEVIKIRHELDNEKSRREKAETRIEEIKEEYKKLKQKASKLQEENVELKQENVESKNHIQGFKSKLDLISDKSHTELEKNSALQDQLSDAKKKLELTEMKCNSYSQKFDILLKRYEARKLKQKQKMERLWDYLQRERTKYKELLANAQNDLNNTKSLIEKEADAKSKQESTYQVMIEEKGKLMSAMSDKDSKIREMKRQNLHLTSRIKYLEEEIENLNEKINQTLKEKSKLRKELQISLGTTVSYDILDGSTCMSRPISPINTNSSSNSSSKQFRSNLTRPISTDSFDKSFKSANLSYWNELNASSSWDVNYNTGNIIKYRDHSKSILDASLKSILGSNAKDLNGIGLNGKSTFHGYSMTNDLNSVASTPRSYR